MIDLIYDCDITMGLPGKDVDDGLALLYLLGSAEIRLLGVTSTFGNSTIEEVHPCLLSILEDLGRSHIPAYRGAARSATRPTVPFHHDPGIRDSRADSDAAQFLADSVRQSPGTMSILATGSQTNLLGAYRLHSGFFRDVKEIVFMGGVSEPLLINGREMAELNLASDPEAALYALYAGVPPVAPNAAAIDGEAAPPISNPLLRGTDPYSESSFRSGRCRRTVISGNLCLQALLTRERFDAFIKEVVNPGYASYLEQKILPWFAWIEQAYGLPGFHAWDATAALYLTDPQLFDSNEFILRSRLDDLKTGYLRIEPVGVESAGGPAADVQSAGVPASGAPSTGDPATDYPPEDPTTGINSAGRINLPIRIRDLPGYWQTLFDGWLRAQAA
ncbi:MAG: nucleoside hydrolase [Spirochaetaceae bacterium]|nr:MAG: nucleoside hydrolase [Spirochaetaceae bacterium]